MGSIVSVNISTAKGTGKNPVASIELRCAHGVVGDAHSGDWHRQVSLLGQESIFRAVQEGGGVKNLGPGSFAENITTSGIDFDALPVGTELVSGSVRLEITQKGKKCHTKCAIFEELGDCIMPRQGIFARVLSPGILRPGDSLLVVQPART